jgi:hypothetical protein
MWREWASVCMWREWPSVCVWREWARARSAEGYLPSYVPLCPPPKPSPPTPHPTLPQLCLRLGGAIGLERSTASLSFPSELNAGHADEDEPVHPWTVFFCCIPVKIEGAGEGVRRRAAAVCVGV